MGSDRLASFRVLKNLMKLEFYRLADTDSGIVCNYLGWGLMKLDWNLAKLSVRRRWGDSCDNFSSEDGGVD